MQKLRLILLGKVPRSVIDAISRGLQHTFGIKVEIGQKVGLPSSAYTSLRKQYRADLLINFLAENFEGKILGITDRDLYTLHLNFVFGQAQLNGKAAILSIARLDPTFYGEKSNLNLLVRRAVKEAIHEIGHTLGLRHCTTPGCVMQFSNSILEVDEKSTELCKKCRSQIR